MADTSVNASPDVASVPRTETVTLDTYQPFEPAVPDFERFAVGLVGSYWKSIVPLSVIPDVAAVTL